MNLAEYSGSAPQNLPMPATRPALVYQGTLIADKGEMLSLTDMWKAAASPENREPFNWARFEGAPFIEAVALAHNLSGNQVMTTKRGKGGATFAHWQIALAYAKYLSPEFHMWCNQVVRERMEGHAVTRVPADALEQIERSFGINRMLAHKVTGIEATMETLATAVAAIAEVVKPSSPMPYRAGRTAGQIWREHGFPPIRITCWFGNRLSIMGCEIEGRGELGLTRARLFDPDKADTWLKNGGRVLVEAYVKERQGQGKLRLVGPEGM